MKILVATAFTALFIISCAHGKTEKFPTIEDKSEAAEVFVIRDNNFLGWGTSLKLVLDDSIIARLRSGEYVTFYLRPGWHSLGVTEPSLTVPFEKGQIYHFLIFAEYTKFGFGIRRIGERQANLWLSKAKPIE